MLIGAQFYTIRDFCKTPEGLYESLEKVADIGYTTVQLSGVCQYDPAEMRAALDSLGLKCVLTHIPPQRSKTSQGTNSKKGGAYERI
jgi:sugar phosphate isomerase/epimerase